MTDALLHHAHEYIAAGIARARLCNRSVLVTVSARIAAPEDLLSLVQHAAANTGYCFLWERPADGFALAAIGATTQFSAEGVTRFTEIAAACGAVRTDAVADPASQTRSAPLFVGGFAFAPEPGVVDDRWRGFPAGLMLLPRLLVARHGSTATLTATCMVDAGSNGCDVLKYLQTDLEHMWRSADRVHDAHPPDAAAPCYEAAPTLPPPVWKRAVADTVADIAHGRLDKLVLARSCTVASTRLFDCGRVLRHLRRVYPSCVLFWMGTPYGDFLGATPEPLVRRHDRVISTAAIAGSTAPGGSAAVARALAQALEQSRKDRLEHLIVVQAITAALSPLCDQIDVAPTPQVLCLDNVQHLMTPIIGRLRAPHHILELVDRLHPTPAVAGHPRGVALQLLRQREAMNRGWYAGPIGWMDSAGDGEFAVAIRSALVRGAEAALYAGAGIVADSDPDAELNETRLKLQPLLSALLEL